MPKTIFAHGWWTLAGAKVSKSRGNIVDPAELAKKYGVDALRYFLLREVTLGLDGSFSEDLLAERYTTDLANNLGNLWFRVASMLEKYFAGKIPECDPRVFPKEEWVESFRMVTRSMEAYDPRGALTHLWNVFTTMNQKIEAKKPWALAKEGGYQKELAETLASLTEGVAHLAILLLPFLPQTAQAILKRLRLPPQWVVRNEEDFAKPLLKSGTSVERGPALFPRLEAEGGP